MDAVSALESVRFMCSVLILNCNKKPRVYRMFLLPKKKLSFLSDHLSEVFDMGEEEHDIILQKVQESKVRHFVHESLSIQMLS